MIYKWNRSPAKPQKLRNFMGLLQCHNDIVRDTISESLLDFPLKSQTPVEASWSLRSIDLRVIALHPFFVNLRMPQNASLVQLINEPIRVNVFSFVIHERGNSQYPEQDMIKKWNRSPAKPQNYEIERVFCSATAI